MSSLAKQIMNVLGIQGISQVLKVDRIVKGGQKFYSADNTRTKKRICNTVLLDCDRLGTMLHYITISDVVYAVVSCLKVDDTSMLLVKQRMTYTCKNILILSAKFQTLIKMMHNVIAEMTMHRLINDHISGSDSSEGDSEERNSSHKVIVYSRSPRSDSEGGRDEDSINQPLSEQESQGLSILSYVLRQDIEHNGWMCTATEGNSLLPNVL